ncbi:hypothetical protein LINPERHAP1_LOCUS36930 [Linum perenne]
MRATVKEDSLSAFPTAIVSGRCGDKSRIGHQGTQNRGQDQ